jgi:hypothetical protein
MNYRTRRNIRRTLRNIGQELTWFVPTVVGLSFFAACVAASLHA